MVSTHPIKRLRVIKDESGLLLDAQTTLEELAGLPPAVIDETGSASQYLTAYVNWRPQATAPGTRPGRRAFTDRARAMLDEYAPHTSARNSLEIDIARVERFLDGERVDRHLEVEPLTNAAHGVMIVARAAADVFVAIPLGVPVENRVTIGPIPSLTPLVRISEDYETYAALLADQQSASLMFVGQGRVIQEIHAQGASYPFRRIAGGSQRRYQARAGERLDQFARAVAEGVRQELEETGVRVLILVGDEVITSPLHQFLHQTVSDRIIATVRGGITLSPDQLVQLTLPHAMAAERQREAAVAAEINAQLRQGGLAASGVGGVLAALQNRQVAKLAVVDDFDRPGWADYSARVVGTGPVPREHPTGGSARDLVPIAVQDEMVRRALNSGADIEIVHSTAAVLDERIGAQDADARRTEAALALDALGGVGALLRFA